MPADYIQTTDIKRADQTLEPADWSVLTKIDTITDLATVATAKTCPANDAQVVIPFTGDMSHTVVGDFVNIEAIGQFEVKGNSGGNLTLRYEVQALAPNNTHATETIPVGAHIILSSYRDSYSPSSGTVWYKAFGQTHNGQTIEQNSRPMTSTAPGQLQWKSNEMCDTFAQSVFAVATDSGRNVYMGGTTQAGGGDKAWLVKLDKDGNILWSKDWSSIQGSSSGILGLTIDKNDKVLITGWFVNKIDFGNGVVLGPMGISQGAAIFVVKLDDAGVAQWGNGYTSSTTLITKAYEAGMDIAVDPTDASVAVIGRCVGAIDFGDGQGSHTFNGGRDIWILKLDSSGSAQWSKMIGGSGADDGMAVAIDNNGFVIAGGMMQSASVDFGGGYVLAGSGQQGWLAKYNSAGTIQYAFKCGAQVASVAVDNRIPGVSGPIFCGGYYDPNSSFNGVTPPPRQGYSDGFMAKVVTLTGLCTDIKRFGGATTILPETGVYTVRIGPKNGEIFVAGLFVAWDTSGGSNYTVDMNGTIVHCPNSRATTCIAKLDGITLNNVWASPITAADSQLSSVGTIDNAGFVISGLTWFSGTLSYPDGSTLIGKGNYDAAISKFAP